MKEAGALVQLLKEKGWRTEYAQLGTLGWEGTI